jgi:hypothetical protein
VVVVVPSFPLSSGGAGGFDVIFGFGGALYAGICVIPFGGPGV